MSTTDTPTETVSDEPHEIDDRDRRALEQFLTVLEDVGRVRGADGMYLVVSQSGSEYLVDTRLGACECPDHEYRDVRCKHLRRVAFATGERPIPADVDHDPDIGQHVSGDPRVFATDGAGEQATPEDANDDGCDEPWCNGPETDSLPCFDCFRRQEGEDT